MGSEKDSDRWRDMRDFGVGQIGMRALLSILASVALVGFAPPSRADEMEKRAPSADAKPHTWFQSESKSGLRYAWMLPKGYDGKTPRNVSVILHGTGGDYRWGPANNQPGVFRPTDIAVSVDGTSPNGDSRLFLGEKKDADIFATFLGEMRAAFVVSNVFLYGHSQGGFFVVYFAGEHPDLVSGVVAHSSGSWIGSKTTPSVKKVAIAFMHGTLDPVVPYRQSPGARDAYAKAGFKLLLLRRLENWNHWPNAVRATECLDWCEGMTTADPAAALDAAKRILRVKKTDEYQWRTVVSFAAARDVLRRFEAKSTAPLANVTPRIAAEAAQWTKSVEDHGAKHVKVLEKDVATRKALVPGGEWLGHLVSLREDFRGVDSVEAYIKRIGFDEELANQQRAAAEIASVSLDANDAKKSFETVVTKINEAFLAEGFPAQLSAKMDEWKGQADKLGVGQKSLEKFAGFDAWKKGWTKGLEQYASVWKEWKGP